jgi:hypothetical protein
MKRNKNKPVEISTLSLFFNKFESMLNNYEAKYETLTKEEKMIELATMMGVVANLGVESNLLAGDLGKAIQMVNSENANQNMMEDLVKSFKITSKN